MNDSKIDPLLPLPTAVFHILIALADRDRHGYSIMQDVAARTGGKVQLSAGTLYSSVRRMLEQGLIDELAESPDPTSTDERRRYYRLTRFGKRVAAAEVDPAEHIGAAGEGLRVWFQVRDVKPRRFTVAVVVNGLSGGVPAGACSRSFRWQLMFAEQLGDARRTGGLRAAGLWLHAAVDANHRDRA